MSASLRIALAAAALAALALPAASAPVSRSPSPLAASRGADACAHHAPEAARRSGLPAQIILRVMHAESRGRPRAISHKGAMGCMQIMPATWAYLSRRYGLGSDPWDPRMNLIGGALYLAELVRQFGMPGAYSAYNAGPGRYQRYVRNGVPLPAETVAYAAQLRGGAPEENRAQTPGAMPATPRWQEAVLFMPSAAMRAAPADAIKSGDSAPSDNANKAPPHALFPRLRPAAATTEMRSAPPRSSE